MLRRFLILCSVITATSSFVAAQAKVHVEPANLQGPRALQDQTAAAVIRDYLQSWKTLGIAMEQNRADLLDRDFVGSAKEKLDATIGQQSAVGIRTRYQDRAHDIHIVFYSPEGLSIELIDNVEYELQILDHDKVQTTQQMHARCVVILTPAEVRWRVRVFQANSE